MQPELIIFLLMVGSFMLSCFAFKLSAGIGMVIAAIVGALAGGMGFPVAQFVEGTFAFLDTILVIAAAMIFMKCIQNSGALDVINRIIIRRFARYPALLLICLMFVIMFPGMITGSSTAAVISAGVIVAPILMMLGVPKDKAGAILALGGMFGATAPPVNMAVMAIGGGIDMPYTGFDLPLILLSFPLAIFSVLFLGYKHVKKVDVKKVAAEYQNEGAQKPSLLLFMPLIVMVLLMVLPEIFPSVFPSLGMTLIFLICAVLAMFTGKKMNPLRTVYDAVNSALPVMGILMGVGMFIQIMTRNRRQGIHRYFQRQPADRAAVRRYRAPDSAVRLDFFDGRGNGFGCPVCTLFDQQRSDDRRLCDCVDCQRRRIDAAYGTRGHVCGECCR